MVVVKHLPFSFDEKVDFVNYCQRALNLTACYVPKTTLTSIIFDLYKKKEKRI